MNNTIPIRRRLVGAALRRYRENIGHSLDDAARVLECDRSKISRIETGHRGIRIKELRELLAEYGVAGQEQDALLSIARPRSGYGWWGGLHGCPAGRSPGLPHYRGGCFPDHDLPGAAGAGTAADGGVRPRGCRGQPVNTYTHHEGIIRGAERAERNMLNAVIGRTDDLDKETLDTLWKVQNKTMADLAA